MFAGKVTGLSELQYPAACCSSCVALAQNTENPKKTKAFHIKVNSPHPIYIKTTNPFLNNTRTLWIILHEDKILIHQRDKRTHLHSRKYSEILIQYCPAFYLITSKAYTYFPNAVKFNYNKLQWI